MKELIEQGFSNLKNESIFELKQTKKNVLVVIADTTSKSFWIAAIQKAHNNTNILWANSEQEADLIIQNRLATGKKLDLVVSELFISGNKAGFDLWNKHAKPLNGKMILTSSLDRLEYIQLFEKKAPQPEYLKEPLVPIECIEAVFSFLQEKTNIYAPKAS